jgi:hypothetical protein
MDPNTIQQIATEVVHRLLPYADPWAFWPIVSIITALVAGAGAWGGAFFKIKGENFATKQDFEGLQERLKATTELVEGIKSEVSQRDWAQREWTNLRRVKLEALLEKVHACETYTDQYRNYSMDHTLKAADPERNPTNELQTIAELYLPELRSEVFMLHTAVYNQVRAGMNLRREWFKMARDVEEADKVAFHAKALDEYGNALAPAVLIEAVGKVRDAARTLLLNIMDVDEQPAESTQREGAPSDER